jgi:ABC-2 type transport system permease protein
VATFEFLTAVRRVGYLLTTFGMPVFVAFYGSVVAIPAYYMSQDAEQLQYGVVDEFRVLGLEEDVAAAPAPSIPEDLRRTLEATGQAAAVQRALAASRVVFRPFGSGADARAALAARTIKGYFVVPQDFLATGRIEAFEPDSFSFTGPEANDAFEGLVRSRLVARHVDATMAARIMDPVAARRSFAITRDGDVRDGGTAATIVRLVVPLIFMVLFLLSVLMTSGYLMQGTATEKENKVVEVLLASANPDEILAGKLLGLGGAGLLQITVWLAMLLATTVGVVPLLMTSGLDVPWRALLLAIPFFLMAFLFFGGLIIGSGSLGTNMREAQQLAMIWSLIAALPLMVITLLLRDPNGTLARVMTWIPFTSGPVVILRASTDAAALAWWEAGGALVVLAASTWIAVRIGARLFRIGLLSAGTRPGFREILRQARP